MFSRFCFSFLFRFFCFFFFFLWFFVPSCPWGGASCCSFFCWALCLLFCLFLRLRGRPERSYERNSFIFLFSFLFFWGVFFVVAGVRVLFFWYWTFFSSFFFGFPFLLSPFLFLFLVWVRSVALFFFSLGFLVCFIANDRSARRPLMVLTPARSSVRAHSSILLDCRTGPQSDRRGGSRSTTSGGDTNTRSSQHLLCDQTKVSACARPLTAVFRCGSATRRAAPLPASPFQEESEGTCDLEFRTRGLPSPEMRADACGLQHQINTRRFVQLLRLCAISAVVRQSKMPTARRHSVLQMGHVWQTICVACSWNVFPLFFFFCCSLSFSWVFLSFFFLGFLLKFSFFSFVLLCFIFGYRPLFVVGTSTAFPYVPSSAGLVAVGVGS